MDAGSTPAISTLNADLKGFLKPLRSVSLMGGSWPKRRCLCPRLSISAAWS